MHRKKKSMLAALILLSTSASPAIAGPTRQEFASALANFTRNPVRVRDIRRLSCEGFGSDEPTEAECRWQQRHGKKWKKYSTYVAVDGNGWQIIDEPNQQR